MLSFSHMASPFDKLAGMSFKPASPEQTAAQEQFENGPLVSPDVVKGELEAMGVRWDFVEGAVAFVKTQTKDLRQAAKPNQHGGLEHLGNVVANRAEHFLRYYTAGRNVEPIGKYDYIETRVTEYLGKKIAPTLLERKR